MAIWENYTRRNHAPTFWCKSNLYIFLMNLFLDPVSEEAKSVMGSKKKKMADSGNDANPITLMLNFKRYVFDKSMAQ